MPDKSSFTTVVEDAYNHIGMIVGEPVVIYNRTKDAFGWTSSVYKREQDDVKIFTMRSNMFNGYSEEFALKENILYDDDLWSFVLISIEYGGKE